MEQFNIFPVAGIKQLKTGQLLIAQPLLKDPHFTRSVILLCEHSNEGSIGFVLNQHTDLTLGDLVKDLNATHLDIYQGGPVQADTLHMMHRIPQHISGGIEVSKGIYWGGSYDELKEIVSKNELEKSSVRLFMGYSGWGPGQLEKETEEGTWLITGATEQLLFDTDPNDIWRKAIELMGKKYAYLANMPTDPQLN